LKKTISTLAALAISVTLAVAQDKPAAKPAAPAATPAGADPIVIAAGDISIRQSEFEAAVKTLPADYQHYASGPGKKQFAEDFLRMKLLAQEGTRAGLDKDPKVVSQLALMKENLIANAQIERIEKSNTPSDDELKKLYETNKNDYETVKARHILIAFKGSPAAQASKPEMTEEQAKAKAEDLRKKVAAGAKFEDVAKAESDDTGSGANGGDLGAFGRGQMVPEFEKAAFETKIGDMSQVIRTQFGYHIIKVDEHGTTPFEQIKERLAKDETQKRMQITLDAMKASAKPTFNTAYFPEQPAAEAAPPAATPVTNEQKPQSQQQ
jgi:peptidyl-prolyl cis-trans isomerase C